MNVEEFSISLMNFYLHYLRSWEDGKHPPQPVSRGVPEVNPVVECRRASAFLPTHGLFSHASGWWWLEPWNFEWLFHEKLGMENHPNWRTHFFQRGWSTTNQYCITIWHLKPLACSNLAHAADVAPSISMSGSYQNHPKSCTYVHMEC